MNSVNSYILNPIYVMVIIAARFEGLINLRCALDEDVRSVVYDCDNGNIYLEPREAKIVGIIWQMYSQAKADDGDIQVIHLLRV